MAYEGDRNITKSDAMDSVGSRNSENTPLLRKESRVDLTLAALRSGKSIVYRVLLTSFLMSLSFGVTQVPLIYVLGLMTCDEYYKTHPEPGNVLDRCRVPEIEGRTARWVALIGAGTTFFGVANLFITGWLIKRFGIKLALVTSCLWPAVRLCIQNVGVQTGYLAGIIIMQCSQIITVFGGPSGYLLALNSYATEIVTPAERTGTLGRLQGVSFFGTSIGYLVGGLLSDAFGTIAPFRVTLALFCLSTICAFVSLPSLPNSITPEQLKKASSLSAFLEPVRMFIPRQWVLADGKVSTQYGITLLGAGAFTALLATGYIPVLLQMYSTDVLDFGTTENGWLISLNSLIRGLFLTFAFPSIISAGREWLDKRQRARQLDKVSADEARIPELPTDPNAFPPSSMDGGQQPTEPPAPKREESFQFDLIYARYSILVDGILTCLAAPSTKGWHLYVVSAVLPLAAGTGSASKGTVLQMCGPSERSDALSAISLIEMVARLATMGVFGYVFSAFATIGRPNLTFLVNGAIAILAFVILYLTRFPPRGAKRLIDVAAD